MAGQWKIQILCSPSLRKSTSWLPDPTKCAFMAKNQKPTSFSAFSSTLKPPLSRVHIQLPWVGYLGGCVWLKTNKSKLAAELDFLPHLIAKCKRQLSKKKIEFLRYNIRFLFHLCLAYMQHRKSNLPKYTQPNQCNFYRTQVSLGSGLWVPVSVSPSLPTTDLWNFADVTLADDDINSIRLIMPI